MLRKLVKNNLYLERILDNLKEGIIAHDAARKIFFFNREAENITGYDREEILGRDCHDVFDGPFCGERCSFCGEPGGGEDVKEYTLNITRKDGQTRHIEMRVTMMTSEDGSPFGALASFSDLTDVFSLEIQSGKRTGFGNIIGRDPRMLQIFRQIRDVAEYDYPVHIYGETGTGKELVAMAIHRESSRKNYPFVPINCGALPEGLLESELFGHKKGAFSGAIRDRKGRFELADKGTIFLDEIAELSKPMQVKLLRFLQENTFEHVGGEQTITVDVHVISATNKNLKSEIAKNKFREDLYYRLNVIPIDIPPLRQRTGDIPLLVEHILKETQDRYGNRPPNLSKDAMSIMLEYRWPGNVRELQNAVQFAVVKCNGKKIMPTDLPLELRAYQNPQCKRGPSKKLDIHSVSSALKASGGNKSRAAVKLGVSRATLYRFLSDCSLPEYEPK